MDVSLQFASIMRTCGWKHSFRAARALASAGVGDASLDGDGVEVLFDCVDRASDRVCRLAQAQMRLADCPQSSQPVALAG